MTLFAKFPGTCKRCGGHIKVGDRITWEKGAGATHVDEQTCVTERAAVAVRAARPVVRQDGSAIVAFLLAARERGLKFPKVRFLAPGGGELRLSVAGPTSKYPGSVQVKIDDAWIGRIQPDGIVAGPLRDRTDVLAALAAIAADPVTKAREYGALSGHCSFCDRLLTDDGSVEVGYGPICAKHYGLPHKAKGTPDVKAVA